MQHDVRTELTCFHIHLLKEHSFSVLTLKFSLTPGHSYQQDLDLDLVHILGDILFCLKQKYSDF